MVDGREQLGHQRISLNFWLDIVTQIIADSGEMLANMTPRTDGTVTVEVVSFLFQYPAGSSDSDIFVKIITCN